MCILRSSQTRCTHVIARRIVLTKGRARDEPSLPQVTADQGKVMSHTQSPSFGDATAGKIMNGVEMLGATSSATVLSAKAIYPTHQHVYHWAPGSAGFFLDKESSNPRCPRYLAGARDRRKMPAVALLTNRMHLLWTLGMYGGTSYSSPATWYCALVWGLPSATLRAHTRDLRDGNRSLLHHDSHGLWMDVASKGGA